MSPHLRLPRPLSLVVHGPLRHATIPLLALAFMAASAVAVLLFDSSKTDLDVFFWPSAEIAVHGHPLLVYTLRAGPYPNANGPVSLLPLGPVAALAQVEMENLIGAEIDRWPALIGEADARLWLYGKDEARDGRKMGHINRMRPLERG